MRRLISAQFPRWADLPVSPVAQSGWDNRTFHLGADMSVRLPSAAPYAAQVEKEQEWLPRLAPHLPLPIPAPLALGEPGEGYPWRWSVYRWLRGETAETGVADLRAFARDLAAFLSALHRADSAGGPAAGPHSFFRGGPLSTYDGETRAAIAALGDRIHGPFFTGLWERALAASFAAAPVWVHGDIATGNLLVEHGRLSAVIDFGCMAVGDPACDLVIAWTLFDPASRAAFRAALQFDDDTWARARGWALWKALKVLAGTGDNHRAISQRVIEAIVRES